MTKELKVTDFSSKNAERLLDEIFWSLVEKFECDEENDPRGKKYKITIKVEEIKT